MSVYHLGHPQHHLKDAIRQLELAGNVMERLPAHQNRLIQLLTETFNLEMTDPLGVPVNAQNGNFLTHVANLTQQQGRRLEITDELMESAPPNSLLALSGLTPGQYIPGTRHFATLNHNKIPGSKILTLASAAPPDLVVPKPEGSYQMARNAARNASFFQPGGTHPLGEPLICVATAEFLTNSSRLTPPSAPTKCTSGAPLHSVLRLATGVFSAGPL